MSNLPREAAAPEKWVAPPSMSRAQHVTRRPRSLSDRANGVGTTFDYLAKTFAVLGALAVIVALFGGGEGSGMPVLAVILAVNTVILWASLSLASIVAAYIAHRTE